ncbi:MAG: S8 family peptidase [Chloroflexota bacterium]
MATSRKTKPIDPARPARSRGLTARVVVKFHDYVQLPYVDGVEKYIEEYQIAPWQNLAQAFPGLRMRRLFTALKPERIGELVRQAVERDSTYLPPNFFTYFTVICPPGVDPQRVAKELSAWEAVEQAYPAPKPQLPPAVNPDNDPRFPFQGYLDAAPAGIDAEFAWGYDPPGGGAGGGDGGGAAIDLRFVDLEQGWVLDHEDLVAKGITLISGENLYYHYHGTAVLGEVTAVDNAIGCIGITPHLASVRVVSEWRDETTYDTADAILSALDVLNFGDVLLLEAQTDYNTYDKVPVEVHAAIFSAIRLGTALGVIIVEAAGNGANDLDEFSHAIYGQMLNRASDDFRDSGAIMVGAATSTVPHSRMSFSNYGSRIDCFAWGENVNTLTGSPGVTTNYTSTFNGTSSASPIVSGAALAVQGILHTNPGYRLGAYPMRAVEQRIHQHSVRRSQCGPDWGNARPGRHSGRSAGTAAGYLYPRFGRRYRRSSRRGTFDESRPDPAQRAAARPAGCLWRGQRQRKQRQPERKCHRRAGSQRLCAFSQPGRRRCGRDQRHGVLVAASHADNPGPVELDRVCLHPVCRGGRQPGGIQRHPLAGGRYSRCRALLPDWVDRHCAGSDAQPGRFSRPGQFPRLHPQQQ